MTRLVFNRATGQLWCGSAVYAAANFVDSQSDGPFPLGLWPYDHHQQHADDAPESAFGTHGILLFMVSGRTGLGLHSGRQHAPDALGRSGVAHATLGCVRTTDTAMAAILETHSRDPITEIQITDWSKP